MKASLDNPQQKPYHQLMQEYVEMQSWIKNSETASKWQKSEKRKISKTLKRT